MPSRRCETAIVVSGRNAWSSQIVMERLPLVAALACATTIAVAEDRCERPELEWQTWRNHVISANPGTDFFELRGDGRTELLRAYGCLEAGEKCPPDRLMVFHCTGNKRVLVAFVKDGCVTAAEDIPIDDYLGYVTGGARCRGHGCSTRDATLQLGSFVQRFAPGNSRKRSQPVPRSQMLPSRSWDRVRTVSSWRRKR